MFFLKKHHVTLFFATWFLLNLVQAAGTGLLDDEAYYWLYSRFLEWGYFDHPPMIAFLIRCGYFLFQNELGVRLLTVILSTLSLFFIYRLLPRKNDGLFYALACSMGVLQVGGIIAVPDIPLTFFVALFFLVYKRFLQKMTVPNALLLGLVMALMLYSKYHGILIILFTLVSNLKLFTRYQAWLAALAGIVLFIPHLYWQYNHDFITVRFHFFERNAPQYSILQTLEFVLGQLLVTGPLVGWLILFTAFKYKPTSEIEKALKYSLVGFYAFFLLSTLKGRAEANWTIPAFVPMLVLSHQYLLNNEKWQLFLIKMVPATLVLVILARVYMLADIRSLQAYLKQEFHQNKVWTQNISERTQGLPVVFLSSYQKASKYWFYSGNMAFSLNTPYYRRNNFNVWPVEDALQGKKVAVVLAYQKEVLPARLEPSGYLILDSFFSFSGVRITTEKELTVTGGMIRNCLIRTEASEKHLQAFRQERFGPLEIQMHVYQGKKLAGQFRTGITLASIMQKNQRFSRSFRVNIPPGTYEAKFAIPSSVPDNPSLNSTVIRLVAE